MVTKYRVDKFDGKWFERLVIRYGWLEKLIRCVAYVLHAARYLSAKQVGGTAVSVVEDTQFPIKLSKVEVAEG